MACTGRGRARCLGHEVAGDLRMAFGWSRTAGLARATGFTRTSQRYRSRRDPAIGPRMRPKELAASRVRHGYGRLHILLRREGWPVNHNRTYPALPRGGPVDPAQSATAQAGPPHPPGTARSGRPPRGLSYGLRVRPALRRRVLPDPDGGRLSQARSPPDSAASEPASLSGCRRSGRPRSGSGPPGRVRVDNGPGCAGRWTNGPT